MFRIQGPPAHDGCMGLLQNAKKIPDWRNAGLMFLGRFFIKKRDLHKPPIRFLHNPRRRRDLNQIC